MATLMNRALIATALALPLSLGACASSGDYPSLARRDAERVAGTANPVRPDTPPPAPPPDAGQLSRIAGLVAEARAAHDRFRSSRSAAERSVIAARGAARASEPWSGAQVALAGLVAARSRLLVPLAELDELYAAERLAVSETVSPHAKALGDARDEIAGWAEEENSVIGELANRLGN